MLLFLAAFWGLILPSFEQTLLERKREMIRELTNSAWSILAAYQRDEQAGRLTRDEAQRAGVALVEAAALRARRARTTSGSRTVQPRMVMHPYRPDLDGQELDGFTDPRGVPIFVEFADARRAARARAMSTTSGSGRTTLTVSNPRSPTSRASSRGAGSSAPGLYIDDVRAEIGRIEQGPDAVRLSISGGDRPLLL